jgi:glycosyltransferase involved in cell wall biosynthesis
MRLVLLTHPEFLELRSQNHFARMLCDAYRARGHEVEIRRPRAVLRRRFVSGGLAKWAGYADQFLLFPLELRQRMRADPLDTVYVVCDQALGPWVSIVQHRPHVVHCHDLLALQSALGEIAAQPTRWTGRIYQRYIRRGFAQARHFISVSRHSQAELHRLGGVQPVTSTVVHNGLNHTYRRLDPTEATVRLHAAGLLAVDAPGHAAKLLLHVGGGQWYKNTAGVLAIYRAHVVRRKQADLPPLPLWLVGPPPSAALAEHIANLPDGAEVKLCSNVSGEVLEALYSLATALLFPSLAEGFGWPIVEAMACGCPVLTTGAPPMNEIGGSLAHYLPRLQPGHDIDHWARGAAQRIDQLLARPAQEAEEQARAAMAHASQYNLVDAVDRYLAVYATVLTHELRLHTSPATAAP